MIRRRLAVLPLAVGILLTLLGAGPALAAGYRYWSFWDGVGGRWTYASQGPSLVRPADGDTVGFRFSVSEDSADSSKPRSAPDFAKICAATPAEDDRKRVALVIDFGEAADAPPGETPPTAAPRTACASVPPAASAAEALASVAKPLRYNSAALLCAISGYPRQGCGDQVAAREPASTPGTSPGTAPGTAPTAESDDGGGPSLGLLAGIAAVLALAAAAVLQSRRRNR
ncbi:SCO2322 family protein [Streptomyces sp. NPDC002073]|uniref:SCO2322 family protein n=1 Tax=Streptomyces sp. NBC_00239 TaxID=2903640 RepID=UPI002E2AD899|nr:SCO2322 family protein [Streptomyces sp. NBC_00239]